VPEILWAIVWLAVGLVILSVGADLLIRASAATAVRFGIRPVVVGMLIVGFGTSAPELVASIFATIQGSDDIAVGNVIGSNITNIGLVLGGSALVWPLSVSRGVVRVDFPIALVGCGLAWLLAADGAVARWEGAVLLGAFASFLVYALRTGRAQEEAEEIPRPIRWAGLWIVLGFAGLIGGAKLFVGGAVALAKIAGVSERVIGLTVVAVGTSLPELASTLVAARKKHGDIGVGNVVGSNIFNILLILGICALIRPIRVHPQMVAADFPVMFGFTIATIVLAAFGARVGRRRGALLLLAFVAYVAWLGVHRAP
jgi:cation:H+ antiporter